MPTCVFRKCTNYGAKVNKAQGITYHTFPSNKVRLQEWIALVRKQRSELDWMPSASSRICSAHFRSEDKYITGRGLALIKKDAVPIIEEDEVIIPHSPSSLDNVSVPEMDEILESPKEAALKDCIKNLTLQKSQLQQKNKGLLRQNRKLKERLAKMAIIIKKLKRRNENFID